MDFIKKNHKTKKHTMIKNAITYAIVILIATTLFNCRNDDDDNHSNQHPLIGKWEVTSGSFIESQPKYLIFNSDNTISFLFENDLEFKIIENIPFSVSGSEIEISVQGLASFPYTLNENTLSIIDGATTLQLIKNENAPNAEDWVETLSVLTEGNAPWEGEVDIAFSYDKTKIIYGMNDTSTFISMIDPLTFAEVGLIGTPNIAKVVEIEKSELPGRYFFQSNGTSNLIRVSSLDGSSTAFNLDVETKISGMASVNANYLWVACNDDEGGLNLINVADNTIERTIPLGFYDVNGLDYQNGFLYVADGVYLHKCQTTPLFKAVVSYEVTNFGIQGIAFDGTNFWASAYNDTEGSYKLIKTSLTL